MLRYYLFNFVNVFMGNNGVSKYCQFLLIDRIDRGNCFTDLQKKKEREKNAFRDQGFRRF